MTLRALIARLSAVAALTLVTLVPGPAQAEEPIPPFYQAPATLPASNGDLIRSENLDILINPSKLFGVRSTATRVLYRSTDRTGAPMAVSGSVIVPEKAWAGPGRRPVIGYAVGTQGIGDSCAPSRLFSELLEYESIFMSGLLARGYAIAMTDYEGLGTAGPHTYMDRKSQGHAVLDIVRAAQRLPGSGLSTANPVAFYGYSQGGAGAASAAELAGSYAPELKVRGTVAGAVPADLRALPGAIDGSLYSEFTWYAIAGLSASYDLDITTYLNADGKEMFEQMQDNCVFDLFGSAFTQSSDYTADGASLGQLIEREPFRTMIDDQRIGRIRPSAPVLVTHSLLDDVVPHRVGKQMVRDWCDRGATVRLSTNATPLHVGGMLNNATEVYGFLEARFAGLPAASSCWRL
ncbi:lipase family protein [Nocardioides campestrisoli]|uniref:lipase family protein n=1 Tax=Nocardioides campestrisoli TaxID=2736757 RepID=UPI0015E6C41E|nr:lipase family protein [Nocardioides campestrisoli]